jgi:3',5'-cyclic AMP phosphodiesterase CpdA
MRTIVHLSDLHFNHVREPMIPKLLDRVRSLRPDIVAISGDFTQHAWPTEFERARSLVRAFPGHLIMVPGNHDMAFFNPWRRAVQRLKLYKEHITSNLQPFYADAEVSILGLSTARISHLRNGKIREWQVDHIEELMSRADPGAIRVLVTHHPFDLPESYKVAELIGSRVIKRVVASVDVLLAGHMHISHAAPTAMRYKLSGHSAIFVQAGTALSTRERGEVNSFQVVRTSRTSIDVQQFSALDDDFHPVKSTRFIRSETGWKADMIEIDQAATPHDLQVIKAEQQLVSEVAGETIDATR